MTVIARELVIVVPDRLGLNQAISNSAERQTLQVPDRLVFRVLPFILCPYT